MAALELDEKYPTLVKGFLKAMEEVGQYGLQKYGEMSFEAQLQAGRELERFERTTTGALLEHAGEHMDRYDSYISHDHFDTMKHQLAAAAFNLMMEYAYANLDDEPTPEPEPVDATTTQSNQGQNPDSPRN